MERLFSAVRFITILPIGKSTSFDPKGMILFFPLVGLGIGGMLAIVDSIALALWPKPVAAIIDVVFLILITGALHVDGLADTADGLYGGKTKERALHIMKDSRVGAMGLIAVFCGLMLKLGGIYCLDSNRSLLLFLIPAYARASMLFGFKFLDYGRKEVGTAKEFFKNSVDYTDFYCFFLLIACSSVIGLHALFLNSFFFCIMGFTLLYYKKKMNCITGDMLGALLEITESGLFLMMSIRGIA